MAWYEDLGPCGYFGHKHSIFLRAVGWLEPGHPYATGDSDPLLFSALAELAKGPWQPVLLMGFHSCGLCKLSGDFARSKRGGHNLFIPGKGIIFVAPELILHYMKDHSYVPPGEFRQAALSCPAMGSREYLKRIKENGGSGLVRAFQPRPFSRPFWRKITFRLKRHHPPYK